MYTDVGYPLNIAACKESRLWKNNNNNKKLTLSLYRRNS